MTKPDRTVIKTTLYIGSFVVILSIITELIFLALSIWGFTVFLGNIWGGFFAVLNFFLMGRTIEKAVTKDEKEARKIIKTSHTLRQIMLLGVAAAGALLPFFNVWTTLLSLFFPRIAIALMPLFGNNKVNK